VIALLIPVLARPARAAPLVESIHAATTVEHEIVFLCSPGDDEEIEAAEATGERVIVTPFRQGPGDYARKINLGIERTDAPWVFQGADDLRFHAGWDRAALAIGAPVTGTNDLGNPLVQRGAHATHSLISREYAEEHGTIDGPGALHEGYHHCWVDNELVETAAARRAWRSARRAHVEHRHHIWRDRGGGRKAKDDATYQRGQEGYTEDYALFVERRPLWRAVRRRR
jgi:glycosyltransferase involved in cell wall biosynthesis